MPASTFMGLLHLVTKGLHTPGPWHDFLSYTGSSILSFVRPHFKNSQEMYAAAASVPGFEWILQEYLNEWRPKWSAQIRGYWGFGVVVYMLEHTPNLLLQGLKGTGGAVYLVAKGLDMVSPLSSARALLQLACEEVELAMEDRWCARNVLSMAFHCGIDFVGPLLDLGCCLDPRMATENLRITIESALGNKSIPFTLIAEACHLANCFPAELLHLALRCDSVDMLEYLRGKVTRFTVHALDASKCSLHTLNYVGAHFVTAENAPGFIQALYRAGVAEHVNLDPKVWQQRFTPGNIPLQPYLLTHRPLELCHTDTKRKEPQDGFALD